MKVGPEVAIKVTVYLLLKLLQKLGQSLWSVCMNSRGGGVSNPRRKTYSYQA